MLRLSVTNWWKKKSTRGRSGGWNSELVEKKVREVDQVEGIQVEGKKMLMHGVENGREN